MTEPIHFDIELVREVSAGGLHWPVGHKVEDDSGLGGNRDYYNLRGLGWADVSSVRVEEDDLIARLIAAEDSVEEYEAIEEEWCEEPGSMMGLDVGVAAATAALSAAGCTPYASCNGGAFGDSHHESHPLVAFYARAQHVPILMSVAERTDCGLERTDDGGLLLYAQDIRNLPRFAAVMIERQEEFRNMRFSVSGEVDDDDRGSPDQPGLFD